RHLGGFPGIFALRLPSAKQKIAIFLKGAAPPQGVFAGSGRRKCSGVTYNLPLLSFELSIYPNEFVVKANSSVRVGFGTKSPPGLARISRRSAAQRAALRAAPPGRLFYPVRARGEPTQVASCAYHLVFRKLSPHSRVEKLSNISSGIRLPL